MSVTAVCFARPQGHIAGFRWQPNVLPAPMVFQEVYAIQDYSLQNVYASYSQLFVFLSDMKVFSSFKLFSALDGLVCIYCGYNVIITWGLTKLVSLFQNIYAKPTFLCWHWGWSQPGCLSSSVVILCPKPRWDDINLFLWFTRDAVSSDERQVFNQI